MYKKYIKRFLDVIFALIALPFWLVLLIIVGPIIYFQDKGPIFYNAFRLGKNGRVFKMYKFRSMKVDAPDIRNEDGSTYNAEDDPRLTRIGKFIRKTSIDETPQLLNVLKGDMSLIGPRPDLPEQEKFYSEQDRKKLEVRPGITGYNQAYYRNTVPWKKRIENDIYYINHISFWLDFKILIKTITSIIRRENIYIEDSLENKVNLQTKNK